MYEVIRHVSEQNERTYPLDVQDECVQLKEHLQSFPALLEFHSLVVCETLGRHPLDEESQALLGLFNRSFAPRPLAVALEDFGIHIHLKDFPPCIEVGLAGGEREL